MKPFAFVLMPFSPEFDDIYKLGIQAAAGEAGFVAERVDEQKFSERMLDRIYRQIEISDVIIADMTGKNPNVFYEVGYAHANKKMCILLTQDTSDIPFDLKHHRHIVYQGKIQKLKADLLDDLKWAKSEIENSKAQIFDISLKKCTADLENNNVIAKAKIEIIIQIKNVSKKRSPEIEQIYLHSTKGWLFSEGGNECLSSDSDICNLRQHFVKPPVARLSKNNWAQIKIFGEKTVWTKWSGEEPQDSYKLKGNLHFDLVTSEGNIRKELYIDVEADEIPF